MKKICLLLIMAIVLACFFPQLAYAEHYQTSIISPRQDDAKVSLISCSRGDGKSCFLIQDKNTGIFYLSVSRCNKTKYVNAEDGLNLRSFPNVSYDNVVKVLPYGSKVQVIGIGNGWAIVKMDGKEYFCWNEYLSTKRKEKAETPIINAEYTSAEFQYNGVINWGGWRWTWYSQNVLPGGGLDIPGRHVDENGYVCDENGYICLASSVLERGSVVDTPLGKQGKVYDSGCAADTIDVYVNF